MAQNFDQAKCDNTFWPRPNIMTGSVLPSFVFIIISFWSDMGILGKSQENIPIWILRKEMNSRSYSHNQINRYIVLVHIQYSYLWEKSEIDIECDRDLFFSLWLRIFRKYLLDGWYNFRKIRNQKEKMHRRFDWFLKKHSIVKISCFTL